MPAPIRVQRRPRVGLAFGGGLPFGVAAIGVIEVFERHGIPIDCMAGVSMGSIIGVLYAYGYGPKALTTHFERFFKRHSLVSVLIRDVRLSRTGFVHGKQIMRTLSRLIPEKVCFEDLKIPFAVPAADLLTGQEVVFHKGPVLPAIRASISMPGIFVPVPWRGTYLVDGAVITPIPVHLLELLGADLRIPMRAVRRMQVESKHVLADTRDDGAARRPHAPDLLSLMWRSLSLIMQDQYAETLMARYPIAIRPQVPFDYAASPDKLEEIIAIGRAEAERHVPAIQAALRARGSAREDGKRTRGAAAARVEAAEAGRADDAARPTRDETARAAPPQN